MPNTVAIYSVSKSSDEGVTSSTALQDDDHLFDPVYSGRKYKFRFYLVFNLAGITSGYKFGVTLPGSSTGTITYKVTNVGGAALAGTSVGNATGTIGGALAATGDHICEIEGFFTAGADGNIRLQFAQNVSSGNALTVKAGSVLEYYQLP